MNTPIYRERTLSTTLRRAADMFPAVVVTGPRQAGKTTLVRREFGDTHTYCSLDDPSLREAARSDPVLLLRRFPPPLILDEIQYAPELLHLVKLDIDEHRDHAGRFIITGSQVFSLMQGVTESLAGRAAVLQLQSLGLTEVAGLPDGDRDPFERLRRSGKQGSERATTDMALDYLVRGGFPEPALRSDFDPRLWFSSYVQTYLERDVRTLRNVGDLADFQRFLVAVCARAGGLTSWSDIGRDLGVTDKTAHAWASVLETSGQATRVLPFFANVGKRLVKRPKVYLCDVGVMTYLMGIRDREALLGSAAAGGLFEAAVYGQLLRLFQHRGERPPIHFWRTSAGHEVDFIIDDGQRLIPVEAKLTATPRPRHAEAIERFQTLFGERADHGLVVCLVEERRPLTRSVDAVPLGAI